MTYSIVAWSPETGEVGVATQSRWPAVGSIVAWAQPGAGAVATQADGCRRYGHDGLARLSCGDRPADALAAMLSVDAERDARQVLVVSVDGHAAAHTGVLCGAAAGHLVTGDVVVGGNLCASQVVWERMLAAYRAGAGPLAGRLLDALDAGEAAGGDRRGVQSAALIVVPAVGAPWDRTVDVRVDDHPDPLRELRRVAAVQAAAT